MWVDLAWEGMDPDHPLTLPDGRDISDVIASGNVRQIIDQVWLKIVNYGKPTDMLWSTGMAITVVSRRMADALIEAGAEDVDVFPVTVRRQRSPDLEDYVLLVCNGHGADRRVREFPLGRRSTSSLDVHADVLAKVRQRGCAGFEVEDARQLAEDIAAEQSAIPEDPVCRDPQLWSSTHESGATRLRLTIDETVEDSLFAVPVDALSSAITIENLTENPDGSLSSHDATPITFFPPFAKDASGMVVNSFLVQDDEQLLLNVDHFPGSAEYPLTVDIAIR